MESGVKYRDRTGKVWYPYESNNRLPTFIDDEGKLLVTSPNFTYRFDNVEHELDLSRE